MTEGESNPGVAPRTCNSIEVRRRDLYKAVF
jgi:hypothetical protein